LPFLMRTEDKVQWAQDYADELLGNRHAYRLAIHDKPNNPHAHLMFTERGKHGAFQHKPDTDEQKNYFSQQNPKDRNISQRGWLTNFTSDTFAVSARPTFLPIALSQRLALP